MCFLRECVGCPDNLSAHSLGVSATVNSDFSYIINITENSTYPLIYSSFFYNYYSGVPQVTVNTESGGLDLTFLSQPNFSGWKALGLVWRWTAAQKNQIVTGFQNPVDPLDLTPPGTLAWVGSLRDLFLSTDQGISVRLSFSAPDFLTTTPSPHDILLSNPGLYPVFHEDWSFQVSHSGDIAISFLDPEICFLRYWIPLPSSWTSVIRTTLSI